MAGWLAGVLVLTAAAGWAPAQAGTRSAAPSPADVKTCGGLPSFPAGTASEIMAGRLTIAPFRAVTIDPHRDGNIDWAQDPYGDPTWVVDFQDGQWIEALVEAYLAGGPDAAAYRDRAKALLLGWLSHVPAVNQQPDTLICSAEAFPGQAWIHNRIPGLLDYQAAHWQGAYNHGLKQDLQLLTAGCAYPAGEWGGQPATWRRVARQQMIDSFEPNQYGPALDAQGVTNEQSTGYANFDMGLWDTAEADLAACGLSLPGWITARIAQMPAFLAMATQPDGDLAQIGDTYVISPRSRPGTPLEYAATRGAAGTPPAQRVAVYQAGYVFGRSGWGTAQTFGDQSFYSLRFGPGTQIHGHADHMGLTYYARGRNLIVDAGHYGYQNTPYRTWLKSPEAASMLVMPGVRFEGAAPTSLVADQIGRYGQFYELYDTAFGGDPRYRSVYVDQRPDIMVVFDRASGAPGYQQLWHLDPALSVISVGPSSAIASAPGTELALLRVALPGQVIPSGSVTVVRGQTDPYQGWVSHQMLQRIPADVVEMNQQGPTAAMLTVLVPTAPGTPVTASATGPPSGPYLLQVRVGHALTTFTVTANGVIS